jgi:hypothetical protein
MPDNQNGLIGLKASGSQVAATVWFELFGRNFSLWFVLKVYKLFLHAVKRQKISLLTTLLTLSGPSKCYHMVCPQYFARYILQVHSPSSDLDLSI